MVYVSLLIQKGILSILSAIYAEKNSSFYPHIAVHIADIAYWHVVAVVAPQHSNVYFLWDAV